MFWVILVFGIKWRHGCSPKRKSVQRNEKNLKSKIHLQVTDMIEIRRKASYSCLCLTVPHLSTPCPCWGIGPKVWQRRLETNTRSRDGIILHQNGMTAVSKVDEALSALFIFPNLIFPAWNTSLPTFFWVTLRQLHILSYVIPAWFTSCCVHQWCPLIHPLIVSIVFCCNYLIVYDIPH